MRALAARLGSDARVRWIEPLPQDPAASERRDTLPRSRDAQRRALARACCGSRRCRARRRRPRRRQRRSADHRGFRQRAARHPGTGGHHRQRATRGGGYSVAQSAQGQARRVAATYALHALANWPIQALALHCVVYEITDGREVAQVLAALSKDAGIVLAQPLQEFHTLTDAAAPLPAAYNDPLYDLQTNLTTLGIARAHARTQGAGLKVALIDTAVDASHPDLRGRIVRSAFLPARAGPRGRLAAPRHGHGRHHRRGGQQPHRHRRHRPAGADGGVRRLLAARRRTMMPPPATPSRWRRRWPRPRLRCAAGEPEHRRPQRSAARRPHRAGPEARASPSSARCPARSAGVPDRHPGVIAAGGSERGAAAGRAARPRANTS